MITKDNILQVRFANPENTVIEVLYNADDGKTRRYNIPARPTNSREWKILKAAGWTLNKVKTETVEWARRQSRMYGIIVKEAAEEKLSELRDQEWNRIRNASKLEKQKFDEEQTKLYESRIAHITADMNTGTGNVEDVLNERLYEILITEGGDDKMVFNFKIKALEDKNNFEGLSKTAEKTKRREIRKASSVKEIIGIL